MIRALAPRALSVSLLLAATAAAQAPVAPTPAPPRVLSAFDVTAGWVQELTLPDHLTEAFQVELFVAGAQRTLFLAPYSLRGPEFQVRVQVADGSFETVDPGPVATVRGFLLDVPGSFFAGSLQGGQLQGILQVAEGAPMWGVQALAATDPTAPAAQHLVFDSGDNAPLPYTCGTPDGLTQRELPGGQTASGPDGGAGSKWVEIACDADVEFLNKNGGSVTQTQNDIENVINGVDAIYNNDFNIRYQLGTILVRTSEPDPYTTTQASALLEQVKNEWLINQTAIHRDICHMFTGKNIAGSTIGVAFIHGICSSGAGFGLSQSKFSSNMTSRIALTAHELGHNWSANHCNGTSQCKIMCSGLGGCSGGLTSFGPSASAEIETKLSAVTCLTGPPPTTPPALFSLTPTTTSAVTASLVTVDGTALEWVETVTFGGQPYTQPTGFFTSGDDTLYLNYEGVAPGIGPQSVTATNSIGTSNALSVTFTESHPPVLINSIWALTSEDYEWKMGGEQDDLWFLALAVGNDTTVELFGYPLLINGILIGSGSLGGNGVETVASPILPSAIGLTFYSQVATIDGGTGTFRGASGVKAAVVLL